MDVLHRAHKAKHSRPWYFDAKLYHATNSWQVPKHKRSNPHPAHTHTLSLPDHVPRLSLYLTRHLAHCRMSRSSSCCVLAGLRGTRAARLLSQQAAVALWTPRVLQSRSR